MISISVLAAVFSACSMLADVGPTTVSVPTAPVTVPEPILAIMLSPGARVAAFVWGLVWGSFANVLIYRIPRGMAFVRERSQCPHCGHRIAAYDNIPVVSFLWLRGKCRHCREPLALRYLVVELLCGVLCFTLYMQFVHVPLLEGGGPDPYAWMVWFVYCLALLVITYIDLDFWIIPDAIVLPLAAIGAVLAFAVPGLTGVQGWDALAAAATGYGMFAGIRWFYLRFRGIEGLGLGDAKLLLMVGAFCGLRGLVWTIAAGAVQGLLVSVPLLRSGRKVANSELQDVHGDDPELGEDDPEHVMGQRVPFGPFLAVAALEYVLLRDYIDAWAQWILYG